LRESKDLGGPIRAGARKARILIEERQMKVGLTGGVASGKSVVGGMLAALGAHVVQADQMSHDLMRPGEPVYKKVIEQFGKEILNPDGTVNRSRLADIVFNGNPPRVAELNAIVHPAVIAKQEKWMDEIERADPHGIAIVEAALILEAGMKPHFDKLIVVTCHPEQRIQRWMQRTGVDYESAKKEVTRRMAAQLPDEEKIKAADFLIDNSGTLDATRIQVESVFAKLHVAS
jgi:dephospho-CoA kinase